MGDEGDLVAADLPGEAIEELLAGGDDEGAVAAGAADRARTAKLVALGPQLQAEQLHGLFH